MTLDCRRKVEDGLVLSENDLKVMAFADCITISANNCNGIAMLNTLGVVDKYCKNVNNVTMYRDGVGMIHLIEVYFDRDRSEVSLCNE